MSADKDNKVVESKPVDERIPECQDADVSVTKLLIKHSGRIGYEYTPTGAVTNIGRHDGGKGVSPDIDLSDDDPGHYISRKHARIFSKGLDYFIEDLGSLNGTYLNRNLRLVPGLPQRLQGGDEITLGRTSLIFIAQKTNVKGMQESP